MSFTGRPTTYLETVIENNGFFPDLSLGDFQKMYGIPAEVIQEKAEHLLRVSIIDVNDSLLDQQNAWQAAGHVTLEAVPAQQIGGKSRLLIQYQRAAFALATAMAFRQYATVTRREIGEHKVAESLDTEQMYRAESNRALRNLRGIDTNITAELI
ncbi:head completion/stabilization protein [uncultured Microbulbifer sp.]|uniref:head completion/stabilization protein n=1 Tax=uncultured Microbulbifer sp. TaxID=348147 RepID=UPI00263250AF|nr:head completion/stabilization protein [uncultured Microbulbifer sp.]